MEDSFSAPKLEVTLKSPRIKDEVIKKEIRKIETREASEKNLLQIEHIKLNTENKLKILKKQTQEEERERKERRTRRERMFKIST